MRNAIGDYVYGVSKYRSNQLTDIGQLKEASFETLQSATAFTAVSQNLEEASVTGLPLTANHGCILFSRSV